jgi:hypothetical protein
VSVKGALEQHFHKQPKPSAQEITQLADSLQVIIHSLLSFSFTKIVYKKWPNKWPNHSMNDTSWKKKWSASGSATVAKRKRGLSILSHPHTNIIKPNSGFLRMTPPNVIPGQEGMMDQGMYSSHQQSHMNQNQSMSSPRSPTMSPQPPHHPPPHNQSLAAHWRCLY